MKKGRFLLYTFYAAGILGLGVFIITKNEYLMYKVTDSMYDDGDLYRLAKVRQFKVPMPDYEYPDEDVSFSNLDSVRIFLIGDSFLETCRGHMSLPVQLSEALEKPVYTVQASESTQYFNPIYFFKKERITRSRPRVVILERVERYIVDEFGDPFDGDPQIDDQTPAASQESAWDVFGRRWFTDAEKNYDIFLTSSSFTAPLVEWWNTACFAMLGRMSEKTPLYSLNPPFLFYDEEVSRERTSGFYYPHPDSVIEGIASNIAAVRGVMKERYNAELLFMAIPNAYTLYHKFINNDSYDDFVPRLETELEKRDVKVVRLYQEFAESKDILYFPTDSHWNARGVAIALRQILQQLAGFDRQPTDAESDMYNSKGRE